MVFKKLQLMLVLVLVSNSALAGITFGKVAELPMRLCLGAAMLYNGKKTYDYACMVDKIEVLGTEKINGKDDLMKGLRTTGVLLLQGIQKGSTREQVQQQYLIKAVGSLCMTCGIAYYFFFK